MKFIQQDVRDLGKFYLGLDLGGTNVRVAIYNEDKGFIQRIVKKPFKKMPTAKEEVEDNICDFLRNEVERNKLDIEQLKGIGISCAALFDRKSGDIRKWPNNRLWDGFALKTYLEQQFAVPVEMEDDANSAALGEYLLGAGKGISNFAYITVSTGIGCGLVLNGDIYTGNNGWAGEIGHIKVLDDGPSCKCGQMGCLQSVASGPAILRRSCEMAAKEGLDISHISELSDIIPYALNGEKWALKSFEEAGRYLAGMIYYLAMILDIEQIVLGGGVIGSGDFILNPIQNTVDSFFTYMDRKVSIRISELGDSSGVIGALSLICSKTGSRSYELAEILKNQEKVFEVG